ncbi:MAG TPA: hypothetical protein VIY52_29130 [Streptosporangiaceae bacterium]
MTIVQFTRFRTTPQREPAVLKARQASLRACRGGEPELRGAYLIRLADGEWLDIAVWAGRPGAEAFDDPALAASRAAFYAQIDELLGEECGILVRQDAGPQLSYPARARTSVAGPDPAWP